MGLHKLSDEELSRETERISGPVTMSLIGQAEARMTKISFIGAFTQILLGSPYKLLTPFVITQTPEQLRLLENNRLEGIAAEYTQSAQVMGTITRDKIRFNKIYLPETDTLCHEEIPSIQYSGTSSNGKNYRGRWSSEAEGADMENSGDFVITRVNDIEAIKKELEKICSELQ